MSTEDDVFQYLTQPENLPVALEISDYVEQLKHNLHRRFWSTFNPKMEQRLNLSEFASTWVYIPHPARRYRAEWGKSYLASRTQDESNQSLMRLSFGQGSRANNFRFFWGARWNSIPENINIPKITTLKAELVARNMNIVEPRWPGYGWYKYIPYESKFMMRMYAETEELIAEIIEDVWQLFTDLRPIIEDINQAVTIMG